MAKKNIMKMAEEVETKNNRSDVYKSEENRVEKGE